MQQSTINAQRELFLTPLHKFATIESAHTPTCSSFEEAAMNPHPPTGQTIVLLALALVLSLSLTALTPTPTPLADWTLNPANRHAYRVVTAEGVNWTAAKLQAAALTYDGQAWL